MARGAHRTYTCTRPGVTGKHENIAHVVGTSPRGVKVRDRDNAFVAVTDPDRLAQNRTGGGRPPGRPPLDRPIARATLRFDLVSEDHAATPLRRLVAAAALVAAAFAFLLLVPRRARAPAPAPSSWASPTQADKSRTRR